MVKNYKGEQLGLANFEGKFSEFIIINNKILLL